MSPRLQYAAAAIALGACAVEPRVELRTGSDTAGVQRFDAAPPIDVVFALNSPAGKGTVADGLTLTLHATIQAPVVNGVRLQATDVQFQGSRLVASYNVRGTTDMGAMQLIDASHPGNPQILVEAIYAHADLNRIAQQGSRVVVAAADQALGATLEHFTVTGNQLTYDDFTTLPSYSATYVEIDNGGTALVTYGDDGGAARYDVKSEPGTELATSFIPDARWIGADGKDLVVVAGSPARLERHKGGLGGAVTTRAIPGGSVGAPTWALLEHGILYVAADEAGVLLFDAKTLEPLGTLPLEGDGNGLALTSDRRLLFVAGGQAGLVAADVANPSAPTVLSSIDVPDSGSANAVAIHAKTLALADGLGGVKLLTFERKSGSGQTDEDIDCDDLVAELDADDDNDGMLDTYDAAPTDPDVTCASGDLLAQAGALAEVYQLGCDHPDVGVAAGAQSQPTSPADRDWFAPQRLVRTIAAPLVAGLAPADPGVAPGACGQAYVATRWRTTAVAAAGDHTLRLGTVDDGWLFVDGEMVLDLGGAHDFVAGEVVIPLTAGAHQIEVYTVRRRPIAPRAELTVVNGPGLTLGERACLAPDADTDGDGLLNIDDVAPLYVAGP